MFDTKFPENEASFSTKFGSLKVLKGEDGYTPQRGIDYWTEEDKAEITNDVEKQVDEFLENVETDSIVIGEGTVSDFSIAGGTTDIDTYGKKAGLSTAEILALKAALALNGGIKKSVASAPMSIALGVNNEASASGAIALGYGNDNSGFNSTAAGAINEITGAGSLAYGYKNTVDGDFATALG